MSKIDTEKILTELVSRALLLDIESPDGDRTFVLPPPMAGFFEFSLMRLRGDIDQKLLSELFHHHRAMAVILGAILKMPPIKQIMASEQMKSKYLAALVKNY